MNNTKKIAVIGMLLVSLLSGCAASTSSVSEASAQNDASSVPVQTTSAVTEEAAADDPAEAAPSAEASEESVPAESSEAQEPVSEYITVFAEGKTSLDCLTYEGATGVWAHLVNPFNEKSLFVPTSSNDFKEDTQNIVICFNVSGVTNELTTFCGLQGYGCGDEDEELTVWNNDAYNRLTGEDFEFTIKEDGYYEMTVPVGKLAAGLEYWEGFDYISIIEVAFYGAEKTDETGAYLECLTDGLSFEFLGIKAE